MRHVVIFFIQIYRLVLGPVLAPACRFEPSCSHYAEEAFRRFGLLAGFGKTISRLLRCQPFSQGGYDPCG